jgi:arylsulfatase A-like enzyme
MTLTRLLLVAALCASSLITACARKPRPFNVLFVVADDWRTEIGCYGSKGMVTPNVDKLSASGVRFDRAYCQFPLCTPSRTSMLTGRYPTVTGVMENTIAFRDAHPDWVTLPQHFRQNGYVSARTGKVLGNGPIDDPKAWDKVVKGGIPRKGAGSATKKPDSNKAPAAAGKSEPKRKGQDPAQSDRIVVLEDPDGRDHIDYHTAQRGIALMEEFKDGGKPFFIAVGFSEPHSPPTAPKRFFDLYDPATIELPPDFQPHPTVPDGFPRACLPGVNYDLFMQRDATPDAAREMIRAYRASASWTDWNVGRVLDALDRLGLAQNTIVIFTSDHGYHLGEKGKWSKHSSLFEVAVRVPFIVRVPGAAGNGRASAGTVELLDLYPTLIELCGLPAIEGLQGVSFASLLKNPDAEWKHPAFSMSNSSAGIGKTVRTERWRYTEWQEGANGHVLFDEQADPHEMKNLADDPAQRETVKKLQALLRGDWTKAKVE